MIDASLHAGKVSTIDEMWKLIKQNDNRLRRLEDKVNEFALIRAPDIALNADTLQRMRQANFFNRLDHNYFERLLTPLVGYFIKECKDDQCIRFFSDFVLGDGHLSDEQFFNFLVRLPQLILFQGAATQEIPIKGLLNIITLGRIKQVTANVFPRYKVDLFYRTKADSMVFANVSNVAVRSNNQTHLKTIWKILIEDIDNFLEAFDILTSSPITVSDASSFMVTYQMSMGVLSQTGTAISEAARGASDTSVGIHGIAAGLIFVPFVMNAMRKLYVHYCTTTPSMLPPLLVFSDPHFYQGVAPVNNRDQIIDEILAAWEQKVTPILVGDPGCGKTSILIELARRIDRKTLPRFSKDGYKVFGGSAVSLASAGGQFGGNAHIERIFKKIAKKKEYTILLLDEIESFNHEQKLLLRTYFDASPQAVRYAVFATTHAGAIEFFKNDDGSLARRFNKITVPDFTREETISVLHQQAMSMASNFTIDPLLLQRIVDRASGKFALSRKMLCQVLRKALKQNMTYPSQEAVNKKATLLALARQVHYDSLSQDDSGCMEISKEVCKLEQELKLLEEQLKSEKLYFKNHCLLIAKRAQLKFKIFDISLAITKRLKDYLIAKGENQEQIHLDTEKQHFESNDFQSPIKDLVKEFFYYDCYLKIALADKISKLEQDHHFVSAITNDDTTDEDLMIHDLEPPKKEKDL